VPWRRPAFHVPNTAAREVLRGAPVHTRWRRSPPAICGIWSGESHLLAWQRKPVNRILSVNDSPYGVKLRALLQPGPDNSVRMRCRSSHLSSPRFPAGLGQRPRQRQTSSPESLLTGNWLAVAFGYASSPGTNRRWGSARSRRLAVHGRGTSLLDPAGPRGDQARCREASPHQTLR